MSYRAYPSRQRALHQLDRHDYEHRPHAPQTDQFRTTILRAYRVPSRLLGLPPTA